MSRRRAAPNGADGAEDFREREPKDIPSSSSSSSSSSSNNRGVGRSSDKKSAGPNSSSTNSGSGRNRNWDELGDWQQQHRRRSRSDSRGGDRERRPRENVDKDRYRERDRDRERERHRERDRERERERDRDRDRDRERDRDRDRERDRDRDRSRRRDRSRESEWERSRDRDTESRSSRKREEILSCTAVIRGLPEGVTEEETEEHVRALAIDKRFSTPDAVRLQMLSVLALNALCPTGARLSLDMVQQLLPSAGTTGGKHQEQHGEKEQQLLVAFVDFPSTDAAQKFLKSCKGEVCGIRGRLCPVTVLLQQPQQGRAAATEAAEASPPADWICSTCAAPNTRSSGSISMACVSCGALAPGGASEKQETEGGWGGEGTRNPSSLVVVSDLLLIEWEDLLRSLRRKLRRRSSSSSSSGQQTEFQSTVHVKDAPGTLRPAAFGILKFACTDAAKSAWRALRSLRGLDVGGHLCGVRPWIMSKEEEKSWREMLIVAAAAAATAKANSNSSKSGKNSNEQVFNLQEMREVAKTSSSWGRLLQQCEGQLLPLLGNEPPSLPSRDPQSGYLFSAAADLYFDPTSSYYMNSAGDYFIHDTALSALRRVCNYRDRKLDGDTDTQDQQLQQQQQQQPTASVVASLVASAQRSAQATKEAIEKAKTTEKRGPLVEPPATAAAASAVASQLQQHQQNIPPPPPRDPAGGGFLDGPVPHITMQQHSQQTQQQQHTPRGFSTGPPGGFDVSHPLPGGSRNSAGAPPVDVSGAFLPPATAAAASAAPSVIADVAKVFERNLAAAAAEDLKTAAAGTPGSSLPDALPAATGAKNNNSSSNNTNNNSSTVRLTPAEPPKYCFVCLRVFKTKAEVHEHELNSKLHRQNVLMLEKGKEEETKLHLKQLQQMQLLRLHLS
ncbi:uncharacterized protein LOC34620700 [Cyclospora cayetanensis]|uniref:Uncharacterized protein LOC34620700 n=1 Tax=Cyclospora cayetanensis TaxID=88456 RepID=A0A6P6RWY3_9EIME|nr:uncharacterized protein LOC34620700 [Cyclospora cayetanensis]